MSADHFFLLGATHKTASLDVREKLALSAEAALELQERLAAIEGLREITTLNTCNRVEFYCVASRPEVSQHIQRAFCDDRRVDDAQFNEVRLSLSGKDAVRHLLEVASGIDSQMLGETEIFGQVKDAYQAAQASGRTGPVLNRLFQKAFQAAKHVRSSTAITSGQVSVANVAVELALTIFGSLDSARIMLLGTGDIGEKTAKAFRSRGAASLSVCGRNAERTAQLAAELSATPLSFEEREQRLSEFDVVVCATSAPTTVIDRSHVESAMRRRPARPLFFIDLALPRDVDPHAAKLQNVFLYDLDDLAKIAEENRAAREVELAKCRLLVHAKTEALWRQIEDRIPATSARRSAPTQAPAAWKASP